ncbi:MAG: GGDEF domain-containing protein [Gammaproteobacteria bacterium]|nr:GGDEF domain-containing protein [Gammaproteobacteria bacterium]MDH3449738.1 GGDEF domain-containing protein [Gammaproteobacteria bacterium]
MESQPVSSHHLQQQELVAFLYHRFRFGIYITLLVSLLASALAYVELAIQGREHWVVGWFALLCLILLLRWRVLQKFLSMGNKAYFHYQLWHRRFFVGVTVTGLMLGCGAALLMPYITTNVQIILHSMLLTMCAGAIAYLSTSFRVYITYMITIMLPVTIWLFLQQNSTSYVLSSLYLFFMIAGWISVMRMNELVNDALYYRYDNEALIEDLQRLLQSVSQSNKALEKISTTDELTGISNYRAFRVQLEEVWRQYMGNNLPVSLVKFNIDYYHEFNAHYGQEAGDRYLRQLATLLSDQVSHKSQVVARLQGAEFALLLPGVSCENARQIAQQIIDELAHRKIEHVKSRGQPYLTVSAGLGCQTVAQGTSSRELLVRVDTALKLATERGRDRLEVLEG